MPFRHLLYNRRNGAPRRPPQPEQMAIPTPQFYNNPQESSPYQWSDMGFQNYADPMPSASPMDSEQSYRSKHQALSDEDSYSHGTPYFRSQDFQPSPDHRFSIHSENFYSTGPLSYSDLMDADVSSISQASIYSSVTNGSMLDGLLDDDTRSFQSSRKPSAASDQEPRQSSEMLCPLISGQVGHCEPSRCGPDAPCLNFAGLAPIEECASIPCMNHQSMNGITNAAPTSGNMIVRTQDSPDGTDVGRIEHNPTPRRSRSATIKETKSRQGSSERQKPRTRTRRNNTSAPSAANTKSKTKAEPDDVAAVSEHNQKSRARQAHSLVEKKYRENLNAKIVQLHQTLQQTQFGPRGMNGGNRDSDEMDGVVDDEDVEEGSKSMPTNSGKVKKSDVLVEAMNYVNATEVEMRHMADEIRRLTDRLQNLEKLVKCEDCGLLKQMVTLQLQRPR